MHGSITRPRSHAFRALLLGVWIGAALHGLSDPRAAFAHGVVVDGDAAEWTGALPNIADLAHIPRFAGEHGELVWWDASSDALGFGGSSLDLTEVRVTGDVDRLYVMARLAAPPTLVGAGAPQLQVAVDLNRFMGLGQSAFDRGAETSVAPVAAWEYLMVTRFGSGQPPMLLDGTLQALPVEVHGSLSAGGVMELSVPWSAFGSVIPSTFPLRLTIALFGSTAEDSTLEYGGPDTSDVVDAVTDYGAAGIHPGTWIESMDGTVDDYLDVYFSPRGEVFAPLVVTEVYTSSGVRSQWVEIFNAASDAINLGSYKLGDEETPGENEGMGRFPSGALLQPGESYVVAEDGGTFLSEHGVRPDAEFSSYDAGTPDMLPFTIWAAGASLNLTSNGDQVLLLDATDTIVDVLTYKFGVWPGVTSHPGVAEGLSMERAEPEHDSNDCGADFFSQVSPTPGEVSPVLAVGPPTAPPSGRLQPAPNPFRTTVWLSLGADDRPTSVTVLDVRGRRVRELAPSGGTWGGAGVDWDGRDGSGRPVGAGMYLFVVRGVGGTRVGRAVLLR